MTKKRRTNEKPRVSCSIDHNELLKLRARATASHLDVPDLLRLLVKGLPPPPQPPPSFALTDVQAVHRAITALDRGLRERMDRALAAYEDRADEVWLRTAWAETTAAIQALRRSLPPRNPAAQPKRRRTGTPP